MFNRFSAFQRITLLLCFLFANCIFCEIKAQNGVDTNFGRIATSSLDSSRFNDYVTDIVPVSNNKTIVVGNFSSYNGVIAKGILRFTEEMTLDNSFYSATGFNNVVHKAAIQTDGKVIAVGEFSSFSAQPRNGIVRLNPDGDIDLTFSIGTGFDDVVYDVSIQSDGKIIAVGQFDSYNGNPCGRVARLNADGSFDATFNCTPGFSGGPRILQIDSNDRLTIAGFFSSYNGQDSNNIIRLTTDGSWDSEFNVGSGFSSSIQAMEFDVNGKLLVAGPFTSYNNDLVKGIVRLTDTGDMDASFVTGEGLVAGVGVAPGQIHSMSPTSDGGVIILGEFSSYQGIPVAGITKIHMDGSLDMNFRKSSGFTASGTYPDAYDCLMMPNGTYMIGGRFTEVSDVKRNHIAVMDANGYITDDMNLHWGFNTSAVVHCSMMRGDDRLLIGGTFTHFNSRKYAGLIQLTLEGAIDTSFIKYPIISSGMVRSFALQPGGELIIAGTFTQVQGQNQAGIARLDVNGNLDPTLSVGEGVGFSGTIKNIVVQPSGKIVMAGDFTSYDGITVGHIVRVNSIGILDNTFTAGSGFSAGVNSLIELSNEKLLAAGSFSSFNGVIAYRMQLLSANGVIDETFDIGNGPSSEIVQVIESPEGDIFCLFGFSGNPLFAGDPVGTVFKISATGALITDFTSDIMDFGSTVSMIRTADGGIVVGGHFGDWNGNFNYSHIVKLTPTGSLDLNFNPGSGVNSSNFSTTINTFTSFPDNRLFCGGKFQMFDGYVTESIICLISSLTTSVEESQNVSSVFTVFPNPCQDQISIKLNDSVSVNRISVYDASGRLVFSSNVNQGMLTVSTSEWPVGYYMVHAEHNNAVVKSSFAKL